MLYSKVYIDSFGYELAPNVVTSADIEKRLEPFYEKLHFKKGQLESLTGIYERRFWDYKHTMHEGAVKAGNKAIEASEISPEDIGMVIYGGVCRDNLEPATACAVAHKLGIGRCAQIYDVSNACLGVLNGMIQTANAIELGHIKAGLVVSCESSRQIIDSTIKRLLELKDMDTFKTTLATLTGGSGAVAVLLTDQSFSNSGHRFLGGVMRNATEHYKLCRWGPDTGMPASGLHVMETDSVGVLQNGVALAIDTYKDFKKELSLTPDQPDKVICHQVGEAHQNSILDAIGISKEKDFITYPFLGNIGTVSLPISAAIANEREFLIPGDLVSFLGIGSGLNCTMLGVRW
ncbi:MAG: 3-oxoacyl-ACP synthase III [Desulfobacterales bacterium]|jgi:acyl-CoA:acyl-CoA alkyltransferase|nr:3-oxoacyl-ACP synthase III [Desulfobacteraceae bacterium]MBT7085989.1 3-oxoacyl-ACP synthase III [Desulfobacterales bacterium]MBT7698389.1 3-oxoacyl-ACP synthase III [Desulfobacterales bacterium]